MGLFGVRDGLYRLRQALAEAGILADRDDLPTLEISYEAGFRFEGWLAASMDSLTALDPKLLRTIDGERPMRVVTLDGFKVSWPLKRMALPQGGSIPEPLRFQGMNLTAPLP